MNQSTSQPVNQSTINLGRLGKIGNGGFFKMGVKMTSKTATACPPRICEFWKLSQLFPIVPIRSHSFPFVPNCSESFRIVPNRSVSFRFRRVWKCRSIFSKPCGIFGHFSIKKFARGQVRIVQYSCLGEEAVVSNGFLLFRRNAYGSAVILGGIGRCGG